MATCKDCIHHDICDAKGNLILTINDICELEYRTDVSKWWCKHFKPSVDVVPKSEYDAVVSAVDNSTKEFLKLHDDYQKAKREVDRLRKILDSYALQYGTVKEQQDVIDKANQEFAREIFEEIESAKVSIGDFKIKTFKIISLGEVAEQTITGDVVAFSDIAELKKKYTEQCPDCKHFVGCEEAVWSGRCEDFDFVRKEDDAYEKGYNDALKDVKEMILERKNENTPKI